MSLQLIRYSRACGSYPNEAKYWLSGQVEVIKLKVLRWLSRPGLLLWSVCRIHNPVLSSFMTYHRICNKSNTTDATSGAGTVHSSGAPNFTPGFSGVHVAHSLVFCVLFCRLLFIFLSFFCHYDLCFLPFFNGRFF